MVTNGWTRLKWKKSNLCKGVVPNYPGLYKFFDRFNRLLYTGHSKRLRHRLQSYYQKDCFKTHPTKQTLRWHIDSFAFIVLPVVKARKIEKRIKHKAKFNYG